MEITATYSWWWLVPAMAIAALAAWWLYFRKRDYEDWTSTLFQSLRALRFLLLFALMALLVRPVYKIVSSREQKPILALVMDNSASLGRDSASMSGFLEQWNATARQLSDKYEVRRYNFGDGLTDAGAPDFTDRYTDFSAMMNALNDRLYNRHVGAVVVASDGAYNRGMNPEFVPWKVNAPIYTVALGDTTVKTDLSVRKVLHNQFVFLGNDFTLEAQLGAIKAVGEGVSVRLLHGNTIIEEKQWTVNSANDFANIGFTAPADLPGVQRYSIVVDVVAGEENTINNRIDFYVDVLDSRIKVLLLANAPHPDLQAVHTAIAQNEQYEVETGLAVGFTGDPRDYNLLVLHNLPTGNSGNEFLSAAANANVPMWVIAGAQTDLPRLSGVFPWANFQVSRQGYSDVLPAPAKDFNLFSIEQQGRSWNGFPPLKAVFADYAIGAQHQPLLMQRIGSVSTEMPLWTFIASGRTKYAITIGEGLWQWRMHDYQRYGDHKFFDQLVSKTVQYLALRVNKDRFQVEAPKKVAENEQIIFRAEVYNESYELDNSPEVALTITDTADKEYAFHFDRTSNAYKLETGSLAPGNYTWEARVSLNGELFTSDGQFAVEPVRVEFATNVANHGVLSNLAQAHEGNMYTVEGLQALEAELMEANFAISKSYEQSESRSLIDWKWLFFILLALVTTEWFLRKRHGYY